MAEDERLGASFSIDVTDLKAGLTQANKIIRESESEFKAAAAGMDDWTKSEDGLNARISSLTDITEIQKKKVSALQNEYQNLIDNGLDPASKEAVDFRTKINNEIAALNKNEKELKKQKEALKELKNNSRVAGTEVNVLGKESKKAAEEVKELKEETEDAGKGLEKLKGVGGIAVKAIGGIAAVAAGAVTAFLALGESTKETQTTLAKLDHSFSSAGFSAQDAKNTLTDLTGVLGDMDKATEASNMLAKMSKNEADLEKNTRILTGVFAEYGDSIPTEGLAEGMQATAEMGSVQGVLADALEWQGVNLDEYNEKLASMSSAEERASYIQKTLTDIYGESADAYKENNKALIESNEAQLELNTALAEIGAVALPIMTEIKKISAELLQSITPFVKLIGEGLSGALNGSSDAADKLSEGLTGIIKTALDKIVSILPFAIETIVSIVPQILTALLGQLPLILQTLLSGIVLIGNSLGEMLPMLIPVVIDAVLLLVETLLDNIDLLINAGISLLVGLANGLILALPQLIEKIPVILEKLISAITRNLPTIAKAGISITLELAKGLVKAIPQLVSKLPQIWKAILKGLRDGLKDVGTIGADLIKGLWNGINDMTSWIKDKIKGFGKSVVNGLKDFFGIHSPSKLMENQIGKNLALGVGRGFEKNIGNVNDEITSAMNFDDPTININGKKANGGVTIYQTNNYSQAHSRLELYKSKQQTAAAVRLAMGAI